MTLSDKTCGKIVGNRALLTSNLSAQNLGSARKLPIIQRLSESLSAEKVFSQVFSSSKRLMASGILHSPLQDFLLKMSANSMHIIFWHVTKILFAKF